MGIPRAWSENVRIPGNHHGRLPSSGDDWAVKTLTGQGSSYWKSENGTFHVVVGLMRKGDDLESLKIW